MGRSMPAGIAYFAAVFLAGMLLGTVRTFVLQPRIGAIAAVLVELPAMLAVSWLACGWAIRLFRVPALSGKRLAMGAFAFLLLMGAELALALYAVGVSAAGHLAGYGEPDRAIGLAGQIAFAAFPSLRLQSGRETAPAAQSTGDTR